MYLRLIIGLSIAVLSLVVINTGLTARDIDRQALQRLRALQVIVKAFNKVVRHDQSVEHTTRRPSKLIVA